MTVWAGREALLWFLQQIIHYDKGVAGSLSPTSVGCSGDDSSSGLYCTCQKEDFPPKGWVPVYARDDGPRFKLPIEGGKGAKGDRQVSSLWTERRRRRRHRRNFLPSPFSAPRSALLFPTLSRLPPSLPIRIRSAPILLLPFSVG